MTTLLVDKRPADAVAVLTLNRPEARNALNTETLLAIAEALDAFEVDDDIHAVVITGGDKVFAAGADVKEMAELDATGILKDARPKYWRRIAGFEKPLIAAVNGFALGGGCELAMHADIIVAGANAKFGLPEINLGIMPGAGGTQRLIRSVGKSLAMKMILSGEMIDADTALKSGLIAEIHPPELCVSRGCDLAKKIAGKSPVAARLAKRCIKQTFESTLKDGLEFERYNFTVLAATEDRDEGLAAFLEKRPAKFKGR